MKIVLVVSKFNKFITDRLLDGCLAELSRRGMKERDLKVVWVPGAFEIPLIALKFAKKKDIHAVICLGAVIRGETFHFDLVARAVAQGIMDVSLSTGKPIIFGVLTTETVEQAYKRSDKKKDDKGRDAATTALEMVGFLSKSKLT